MAEKPRGSAAKRKHAAEDDSSAASQHGLVDVQIVAPVEKRGEDVAGPYLVPLTETQRARFLDHSKTFKAYKKRDARDGPRARALIADLDTTVLLANNYADEAASSSLVNYAVGVYNPQTKQVTVVDAQVLSLRTEVKALANVSAPEKVDQTFAERRNILGETFGTKKVKQAIRAIERNHIDVTSLKSIAGLIEDTIITKAEELPSMDEITLEMQLDRPIPPFNENAERADEIYNFDDIITPEEYNDLFVKNWLKLNRDSFNELKQSRRYPEYVLKHLEQMVDASKKDKRKLKQLLYLTYMIRFWFIRHFDNEDKVHNSVGNDVPKSVLSRFYSLYLEKQEDVSGNNGGAVKYVMSARKKDLLASYILVLCLFIERDLTIDPLSIAPDLKIERSKVVEKLRNLGCTMVYLTGNRDNGFKLEEDTTESAEGPSAASSSAPSPAKCKMLRLQVPLNFPKPKRPLKR